MAEPKRKTTKMRRDKRRSQDKLSTTLLVACKKCGKKKISHRTCPHCGTYTKQ